MHVVSSFVVIFKGFGFFFSSRRRWFPCAVVKLWGCCQFVLFRRQFYICSFVFIYVLSRVFCFYFVMLDQRLWWPWTWDSFCSGFFFNPKGFVFKDPKGSGSCSTRKGLLLTAYWTHPSIWVFRRLIELIVLGGLTSSILWCSRSVEIYRLQGVMSASTLVIMLERAFMFADIQGAVGTWISIPRWRSIHSPILKP